MIFAIRCMRMKYQIGIALCALLVTGTLWAQLPAQETTTAPEEIFQDDFESGDISTWGNGIKVGWVPEKVEKRVALNDRVPVSLTLYIRKDLPATRLEVTPGLDGWVQVSPSQLPALSAGTEVTINLTLTAPETGEQDGTLHVRQASGPPRTFAKPLPIVINGVTSVDETLPPEPDPIEDDSTLLGVDADGDGLRDYIQRYIYSRYPSNPQARAALKEVAIAQQRILAEGANPDATEILFQEQARALNCFWLIANDGETDRELDEGHFLLSEMKDTRLRSDAYLQYMSLLEGQVAQSADDSSEVCDPSILDLAGGDL